MSDVKRYDLEQPDSHMGSAKMQREDYGDWVSFEDYTALRARLAEVEGERDELEGANILNRTAIRLQKARAERAEARLEAVEKDRDQWQKKHESQLKVDFDLVEKYRRPKSGNFHFPEDVAHIIRKLDAAEAALATARRDALEEAAKYHLIEARFCADIGNTNGYLIHKASIRDIRALANEAET